MLSADSCEFICGVLVKGIASPYEQNLLSKQWLLMITLISCNDCNTIFPQMNAPAFITSTIDVPRHLFDTWQKKANYHNVLF